MTRTRHAVATVILAAVTSNACSTPVAVGSMVVGGGAMLGAKAMHKSNCDGEGCVYGNLLAALIGVIGVGLVVGGGIGLAVEKHRENTP
ncbi:MAG: hypothetical protein H0V17_08420 [Deltaproteobacteria bacterium]|nr:hypothetical protein [Deltaproteobacteria bacterium]